MNSQQEHIIRQAAGLFAQRGIRRVSMEAVAQACDCSRRSVYQLFETKDDLVQAVVATLTTTATQGYQHVRDQHRSAPEEVLEAVPILGAVFSRLNHRVLEDLRRHHYNSWLKITTFREAILLDFIQSNLKRGVAEGSYHPLPDPRATATARLQALIAVHDRLSEPVALHQALLQLARQYLDGLMAHQDAALLA